MSKAKRQRTRRYDWELIAQLLRAATADDIEALAEVVEAAKTALAERGGVPEPRTCPWSSCRACG